MNKGYTIYNLVEIWPDGSCATNPGSGGWAAIIKLSNTDDINHTQYEISGSEADTTNNRMELLALIKALESVETKVANYRQIEIHVYTDSQYLQKGVNEWLSKWIRNNWYTSSRQKVKNKDMWMILRDMLHANIKLFWTKGHADCVNNNLADRLAWEASRKTPTDSSVCSLDITAEDKQNTIQDIAAEACKLHAELPSGKINIVPSKPINNRTLPLVYTPGVAAVVREIRDNPDLLNKYTNAKNCVGVISNGTATLGLGNTGHRAVKPVLEGKSNLLYHRAGICASDLIINELDVEKLTQHIMAIADNFAIIVLEDIRAPDCFILEKNLQDALDIPILHDDQHCTAVAVVAFLCNALLLAEKSIAQCKVVINGAGAGGLATANLLCHTGFTKKQIVVLDSKGVINHNRQDLQDNPWKKAFVSDCEANDLNEAIVDADIFIGLSVANVLTADMVAKMQNPPIILALANPVPEIDPAEALRGNKNTLMGTGSSQHYNQVNNMLSLPYLLRVTLDLGLKSFQPNIFLDSAKAIADLARSDDKFDKNHIVPHLLHPGLLEHMLNFLTSSLNNKK